ncbi:hypothetical protein J6500_07265 [Bradyrhizobium sp. WSM 1704]|uniref:hypothetical protein n=1 Tax=Bradyrhizobium semiaridum TaxID=2821404 RepID=UPI001CE24EAB|nr:hypothetical protein [Bradyrhizobium semiaridum]MCA6121700.1 hypothetical protein [Bradyrhizobium semiaridum]
MTNHFGHRYLAAPRIATLPVRQLCRLTAWVPALCFMTVSVALAQQPSPSPQAGPTAPAPIAATPTPVPTPTAVPMPSATAVPPVVTVNIAPSPAKSFGQLMVEALPGAIIGLAAAVAGTLLAWMIGLRLSAGWDMRKKRAEFDQALVQEFNKVVAEFKAVSREREILNARVAATQTPSADQQKAFDETRRDLVKRAVAAESALEAIFLRLLSEMDSWLAAHGGNADQKVAARERQLRLMGLFRVAFRNLREAIVDAAPTAPAFGDPELWLFNRLAAELSGLIYEQATAPSLPAFWKPWDITSTLARPDPAAYLRLIAYRTTDLRMAAASILPDLMVLSSRRTDARRAGRKDNIESLFVAGSVKVLDNLTDTIDDNVSLAIHFGDQKANRDPEIAIVAGGIFPRWPNLKYFMSISDGPPRIVLVKAGGALQTFTELDVLPPDLPYAPDASHLGAAILTWQQSPAMIDAIKSMATKPL